MQFCQDHWDRLRSAISERGLDHLIAPDGQTAAQQLADQIKRTQDGEEPVTPVNYDPLMAARWATINNVMANIGPNHASHLLAGAGGIVVQSAFPNRSQKKLWPRCPLCYINLLHELACTEPECVLDREHGFDMWIERAADDEAARAAKMGIL